MRVLRETIIEYGAGQIVSPERTSIPMQEGGLTGRRTAAVTVLGIQTLHVTAPREILIIGTGKQAANHVEALAVTFPEANLFARGVSQAGAEDFVERTRPVAPNLSALAGDVIPDSVDLWAPLTHIGFYRTNKFILFLKLIVLKPDCY